MNVKELNEDVKNNQKRRLREAIREIEERIKFRANAGYNYLRVTTDNEISYLYEIDYYMIEPLREYFENNGYKIEVKESKGFGKWIEKIIYKAICGAYLPDYFMIISWEEINDKLIKK